MYYRGEEKADTIIQYVFVIVFFEYIINSLLRKATPGLAKYGTLQPRLCLSTLYNCDVYPLEIKDVAIANWMWYSGSLEVLDLKWLEIKTLSIQEMGIITNRLHCFLDWYHYIG